MNKIYDCCVVGAGVVGASIFNKLVRIGKKCLLLDKASDVATGASKANSGIVHSGYDPMPNTLKAKLNVRGNALYPSLCQRLNVPFCNCGAIVVGDNEEKILALKNRAEQNGVPVEIWNRDKILEKVPNIADNISIGLFAPTSAIVNPYYLTISLVDEAIINGGDVSLEEDLVSVKKLENCFEIKTKRNVFHAKKIVNSAGDGYNDVAKIIGSEKHKLIFRRGEYFVLDEDSSKEIPLTIFPLPTEMGKGVLATPTVDGNALVGPTSVNDDTRTVVTREGLETIKQKSAQSVKDLNFRKAIREFSGIRSICGNDFVIEKSKKIDGVINLAGICSPGLTSAPAIAEMVVKLLEFKDKEKENLKSLPKFTLFKNMTKQEQEDALKKDPRYGQIVCKCEKITKGDIIQSLNRPLKIRSTDGVKRRTNAGMGRCQGGFCFTKVIKTICEERGIKYEDVLKENRGSEVAKGNIRNFSTSDFPTTTKKVIKGKFTKK